MIIPIILSGGSGTRLWPLSTREKPKQFLPLTGDQTLFQQALTRLHGLPELAAPIIVCNEGHRFLAAEQLREIRISPQSIVLEPEGRNTAPAIAVAALLAAGHDPNAILLVLPADHLIADKAAFHAAIGKAVQAARNGLLVTFGIVPTYPETGYGYIEAGAEQGSWHDVGRFVEKPDAATAARYLADGRYLWNSGMFMFGAGAFLAELARYQPAIVTACERAIGAAQADQDFLRLGAAFLESPSDSIDYAVMEKTGHAAVVPLDAGWNDVGSWSALLDAVDKDAGGNLLRGNVVADQCSGNFIWSSGRTVAAIGLSDIIVIETSEEVLVLNRMHAQAVKDMAARVAESRSGAARDDTD